MRVLIADDQRILAEGLKMLLSGSSDIEIVGISENGEEAVEMALNLSVDVVLMDVQMPKMSGIEAIKRIKNKAPNIKCVILTTFSDDAYIYEGIQNGASGYLLKDASPSEIVRALHIVYEGGALFEPSVAAKMLEQFVKREAVSSKKESNSEEEAFLKCVSELTEREREIAEAVSEGYSNQEIGEQLFLTEGTVKNHLTKILQKLELRDRTQLAVFWLKNRRG